MLLILNSYGKKWHRKGDIKEGKLSSIKGYGIAYIDNFLARFIAHGCKQKKKQELQKLKHYKDRNDQLAI